MGKLIDIYLRSNPGMAVSLEMHRRHAEGESLAQLASEWQVKMPTIAARILKARRLLEADAQGVEVDELTYLSARPRNCLISVGIRTRDQAKAAFDSGELQMVPNLGAKSFGEVLKWIAESDKIQDSEFFSTQDIGAFFEKKTGFHISSNAISFAFNDARIQGIGPKSHTLKLFPASKFPQAWKVVCEKAESIALLNHRDEAPLSGEPPGWEEFEESRARELIENEFVGTEVEDVELSIPRERGG